MTSGSSNLAAWSYGAAGVTFLAFSVHLWRKQNFRAAGRAPAGALLGAALCSSLWGWCDVADIYSTDNGFRAAAAIADVARYSAWYLFLSSFLGFVGRATIGGRAVSRLVWVAVILIANGLVTQSLAALETGLTNESRWVLLSAMTLPVFAMWLVEQLYRNAGDNLRWSVKPLCLGLTGIFLFDLYLSSQALLFGRVDQDLLQVRGFAHALMVPLLWLSLSRRRDWMARLRVSRQAAFRSATLLMTSVYLLFVSTIGYYVRYFGGNWGRALEVAVVFAALVAFTVIALSGTVRAKLRVLVGKHFFQYRYDYREEWLRFTHTLAVQDSPQDMGQQVIRGLADMLESPGGLLWTCSAGRRVYTNTGRWNMSAQSATEAADSEFCQFLSRTGWVINLDRTSLDRTSRRRAPDDEALVLPSWLQATPQAWLIVPLRVAEELTGFVLLASPRTAMDVNWEVNDLLKTAGRQAAGFLAQMEATEALLEVRKFDAFNRMSAFVVHDLKNIVTQLSLMMKNAKRLQGNPEFQQDMLMTVENSLDRMRQLMMQLREGSTPAGTAFGVDLAAALKRIAAVEPARRERLVIDAPERVTARGDAERLERVVGHLVQNALDATETAGTVSVRLERQGSQARLVVTDTGKGMSREFVRDRLFKPFQTTKQAGMGIGAYESYQYVQELGGSIEVDSELGRGTKVTMILPLFDVRNESDLHLLKAS